MAELTTLEEKLAEVTGLAGAAQEATKKVEGCSRTIPSRDRCGRCARRRRRPKAAACELAEERDGKKTAILEKAQETKNEATEMMRTYLGEDSDELDGFEFLIMAEAGEVGHWAVLGKLNETAGEDARSGAGRVGAADSGAAPHHRSRRLPGAGRAKRIQLPESSAPARRKARVTFAPLGAIIPEAGGGGFEVGQPPRDKGDAPEEPAQS